MEEHNESPSNAALKQMLNTGHTLAYKVKAVFDKQGSWDTTINPQYLDPHSEKMRDIDVIATRHFDHMVEGFPYGITLKLLIECKYIPEDQYWLLWTDKFDERSAKELINSQRHLRTGGNFLEMIENNILSRRMTYFVYENSAVVGQAFEYKKKKEVEQMKPLTHNQDPINKAIGQLIHAKKTETGVSTDFTLICPVLVVNSLKNVRFTYRDSGDLTTCDTSALMQINYNDGKEYSHHLINLVSFDDGTKESGIFKLMESYVKDHVNICKAIQKQSEIQRFEELNN